MRSYYRLCALAALTLGISACDDFSLLDQFGETGTPPPSTSPSTSLPPSETPAPLPLNLSAQRTELERYESAALYPSGGTKPYSFEIHEDDLFYQGGNACQASAANNMFTAGDSIGGVLVRVRDAAGQSAETRIIIRPPMPQNFQVSRTEPTKIVLSWSYALANNTISGFGIELSENGAVFGLLENVGTGASPYTHSGNASDVYVFRMCSQADGYRSVWTAELSP